MQPHRPSGRRRLGLALSLLCVTTWGLLPLALKVTLEQMDALTITWYRFCAAACLMGPYLAARKRLPRLTAQPRLVHLLLALAILGLGGNYSLYILGLSYVSAESAQVVIQVAPALAMLGALLLFGEAFSGRQWAGFLLLGSGLLLFFHHRLDALLAGSDAYATGVLLVLVSAVAWAAYALAQKQLLAVMPSYAVLLVVYVGSTILLAPVATPGRIAHMDPLHLGLLVFCALNTLIGYGAYSEALAHWEASRVNAMLALTPLATLLFVRIGWALWPGIVPRDVIPPLSLVGAGAVVGGSMLIALVPKTGRNTDEDLGR